MSGLREVSTAFVLVDNRDLTVAYAQVGRNFDIRDQLLGENYGKLQRLEMVCNFKENHRDTISVKQNQL